MTAPAVQHRATGELVAEAFLGALPEFSPDMVGTSLPKDVTKWADTGFVTVHIVGGTPVPVVGVRLPVVQLDFWGASSDPNSDRPPWKRTGALAEHVVNHTLTRGMRARVALRTPYPNALVHEFVPLTEPRKLRGDPSGYARITMDCRLAWSSGATVGGDG